MKILSLFMAIFFIGVTVAATPVQIVSAAEGKKKKQTQKVSTKNANKPKKAATKKDKSAVDDANDKARDEAKKDAAGVACRAAVLELYTDYNAQIVGIQAQNADDAATRQQVVNERAGILNAKYAKAREANKAKREKIYESLKARAKTDDQKKAVEDYIKDRENQTIELNKDNDAAVENFKEEGLKLANDVNIASSVSADQIKQVNEAGRNTAMQGCSNKKASVVRAEYRKEIRAKLTEYRNVSRNGFINNLDDLELDRKAVVDKNNTESSRAMVTSSNQIKSLLKTKKAKKETKAKNSSSSSSSSGSSSGSSSSGGSSSGSSSSSSGSSSGGSSYVPVAATAAVPKGSATNKRTSNEASKDRQARVNKIAKEARERRAAKQYALGKMDNARQSQQTVVDATKNVNEARARVEQAKNIKTGWISGKAGKKKAIQRERTNLRQQQQNLDRARIANKKNSDASAAAVQRANALKNKTQAVKKAQATAKAKEQKRAADRSKAAMANRKANRGR